MPKFRKLNAAASSPTWHWYLMLTIVVFEYVRPTEGILHVLAPLRIVGIANAVMIALFIIGPKHYFREEPIHRWLLFFWFLIALSTFYAPNNRASFNTAMTFLWILPGYVFPLNFIVNGKERLYKFFFFWICVQAMLAVLVITGGGHGPGSYLWDENDVALALNMAVPYALYLSYFPGLNWKWRAFLWFVVLLLIAAVGVTASRGGVLGLAGLLLAMTLMSKRPVRNGLILAGVVALVLVILLRVLPSAYTDDMENIDNPQDSTRDERLWSWSIAWVMFKDNPVLGVGAANYPWTNNLYVQKSPMYNPKRKILGGRAAHSVYFTLLSELGIIGVTAFLFILKGIYLRCRAGRRYTLNLEHPPPDAVKFELLFKILMASAVTFLVTGAFITVIYYPPFWHLVGLATVTYQVAKKELANFSLLSDARESGVETVASDACVSQQTEAKADSAMSISRTSTRAQRVR